MTDYTLIILLTLFGFLALAALLLVPVYRFLRREEQVGRKWTREELERRGAQSGSTHDTNSDGRATEKRGE